MAAEIAVTDTHALLWYAEPRAHRKLGRAALAHFRRAESGEAAVYVPALVLVEVSELSHRGKVTLQMPFDRWIEGLFGNKCFIPHPLTDQIVRQAHALFAIPERGDRLIAATAVALQVPLITRDPEIAACAHVDLLW